MNVTARLNGNVSKQTCDAHRLPSFGQLFKLHYALEEAISAAAKNGGDIYPAELVRRLLSPSPQSAMLESDLYELVLSAAARAGVKIRSEVSWECQIRSAGK